jgi:hypothetical protein
LNKLIQKALALEASDFEDETPDITNEMRMIYKEIKGQF